MMSYLIKTLKWPLSAAQRIEIYRSHGIRGVLVKTNKRTEDRAYTVDEMRDVIRALPEDHVL